jgi:alpha-galactosidase
MEVERTWGCVTKTLANGQDYTVYIRLSPSATGIQGLLEYPSHRALLATSEIKGTEWILRDSFGRVALEAEPSGEDLRVISLRGATTKCLATPANGPTVPAYIAPPAIHDVPANGLAQTPPMGWNSWNKFAGAIDDLTVRQIADAMVSSGMRDAGYNYVNIDDGWQGTRDSDGNIRSNPKFPDMKALADYVHTRGLKLGLYSSPGPLTCAGYPGSYGHEAQDAKTFAKWGIDYLKYDWCSARWIYRPDEMRAVYQRMGEALQATDRPIVFSLCQYGWANVWEWGTKVGGNLWRTTNDIHDSWRSMQEIASFQPSISPFASSAGWNDPDMLEVGNGGMSETEYRSHLSLWSVLRAPLLSGNDIRHMDPGILSILINRDVIAIDQDPQGKGTVLRRNFGTVEVWSRQLGGGDTAMVVMNLADTPTDFNLTPSEYGLAALNRYKDLWTHEEHRIDGDKLSLSIAPHGVAFLRFQRS